MKIKKGDTVEIIAGKNRGRSGKVIAVYPDRQRVTVEGVNMYKKHVRPKRQGESGEVVEVARPLHVSNVQIVCKSCGRKTRIGHQVEEGAEKVSRAKKRICKKCNNLA